MPTVTTNVGANTALRFLNINDQMTRDSIGKLSSGSRIVKASDDAASLAISTNLNADVVTLRQAAINAANGNAVLQVADGGLARISDILARMKALAVQALSGSVDATSRGYINEEFTQLRTEITSIAEQTEFNGTELLSVSASIDFMVGRSATETITVNTVIATATGIGVNAATVDTITNATAAISLVATAIDSSNGFRASYGSFMARFDFRARNVDTQVENIEAAKSALLDTDVAAEMTRFTSAQVLMQANVAMLGPGQSAAAEPAPPAAVIADVERLAHPGFGPAVGVPVGKLRPRRQILPIATRQELPTRQDRQRRPAGPKFGNTQGIRRGSMTGMAFARPVGATGPSSVWRQVTRDDRKSSRRTDPGRVGTLHVEGTTNAHSHNEYRCEYSPAFPEHQRHEHPFVDRQAVERLADREGVRRCRVVGDFDQPEGRHRRAASVGDQRRQWHGRRSGGRWRPGPHLRHPGTDEGAGHSGPVGLGGCHKPWLHQLRVHPAPRRNHLDRRADGIQRHRAAERLGDDQLHGRPCRRGVDCRQYGDQYGDRPRRSAPTP